jgi:3-methyladenine DNA glycosylase AlkD
MPTVESVMAELKAKGREPTRKTYARHGARADRMFGVPVADLKVIAKTIKKQQELACALYETGNLASGCWTSSSRKSTGRRIELGTP